MSSAALRSSSHGVPKGAIVGASVLVVFVIASAGVCRITGWSGSNVPQAEPVQTLALRFVDEANGSVAARDASSGAIVAKIAPETNGFMRASLRGLAQERKRRGIGDAAPFILIRWSDGRLSLVDQAIGRGIELEAFGATNEAAFAALLSPPGERP
jgi:putative photosynthetic complex assembly protein